MNIRDIIKSTLNSQPEGDKLMDEVVVTMSTVNDQYLNCKYLQSIVNIKFDVEVLRTTGYTLRQIQDASNGVIHDEADRFILERLQQFIAARDAAKNAADAENKTNQNG